MQERKSILDDYLDEEQAINKLGVNEDFFKWLIYSKRLKFYLLNEENSDRPGTRIYEKNDVERLKTSFCSLITEKKTCLFLCKRNP